MEEKRALRKRRYSARMRVSTLYFNTEAAKIGRKKKIVPN